MANVMVQEVSLRTRSNNAARRPGQRTLSFEALESKLLLFSFGGMDEFGGMNGQIAATGELVCYPGQSATIGAEETPFTAFSNMGPIELSARRIDAEDSAVADDGPSDHVVVSTHNSQSLPTRPIQDSRAEADLASDQGEPVELSSRRGVPVETVSADGSSARSRLVQIAETSTGTVVVLRFERRVPIVDRLPETQPEGAQNEQTSRPDSPAIVRQQQTPFESATDTDRPRTLNTWNMSAPADAPVTVSDAPESDDVPARPGQPNAPEVSMVVLDRPLLIASAWRQDTPVPRSDEDQLEPIDVESTSDSDASRALVTPNADVSTSDRGDSPRTWAELVDAALASESGRSILLAFLR